MAQVLDSPAGRFFAALLGLITVATVVGLILLWPGDVEATLAQGLAADTEQGRVVAVTAGECPPPQEGTCTRARVRLESGAGAGDEVTVPLQLGAGLPAPAVAPGDRVRLAATGPGQAAPYTLSDFERRAPMLWLLIAFAALVVVFARLRGVLSLAGLAASLAVVVLFIVPAMLAGRPPLAVAVVGAFAVMLVTIPLAHGLGAKSVAAMLGTALSLLLTVALAVVFVDLTNLTGLSSEEATLLQAGGGQLSLQGLLLAGMVIAALGVLDDMTISQSSTVIALRSADPGLGTGGLFASALRVGRDHVSATVNTLVLAYVGASLPVLMIFASGELGFLDAVNVELVAKEIVATLVGSIGLIAAAPITTWLAAFLAVRLRSDALVVEEHVH
jgi:uncharacterized membrane protein